MRQRQAVQIIRIAGYFLKNNCLDHVWLLIQKTCHQSCFKSPACINLLRIFAWLDINYHGLNPEATAREPDFYDVCQLRAFWNAISSDMTGKKFTYIPKEVEGFF